MTQFRFKVMAPETREPIQHVRVEPAPDWDDFKEFVEQYIESTGAEIKVADYGMDRHQIDYELDGERYLMHYEHYTQSVWIEPKK